MASPVGSVYVSLGIDTAEFKRGLKSAQDSAKVFTAAIDRAGRDFRGLESSLNPAVAALRQYEQAQRTVANAVRLGAATQEQADVVLAQARARHEQMTASLTRGVTHWRQSGMAIQQAGYQVGDFAVQVASGQGVLRPFIQQGTQLVSMFGPWGAILGAAGAVVGALAVAFLDGADSGKALEDALEGIDDAARDLKSLNDLIGDLDKLKEKYGEVTQEVLDLVQAQRTLRREKLQDEAQAARDAITAAGREAVGHIGAVAPGSAANDALIAQVKTFNQLLHELQTAPGLKEQAAAAAELRHFLEEASGTIRDMVERYAPDLVENLIDVEDKTKQAAHLAGEVREETGGTAANAGRAAEGAARLAGNLGGATDRASALANEIERAANALDRMGASAQSRLAKAQLEMKYRGDPVGLAKATAQLDTGREVAAYQSAAGNLGIPSGMVGATARQMSESARQQVEALTEVARIQEKIAALNKADQASSRGGAKGEKAAERIDREVESMRRRLDALKEEREVLLARAAAQSAGVPADEIARQEEVLTAAFDRQRLVEALLAKAREEHIALSPQQVAEIDTMAAAIERQTIANYDLKAANDAQAKSAEEAARRQQQLARDLATTADRLVDAVVSADSFTDALKRIGIMAANLALQGLGGQGPLGGIFGKLLPGIVGAFGGAASFSIGGTSSFAGFSANPGSFTPGGAFPSGFAEGGVAQGWAVVGERGKELAYFDQPARIFSNSETERMLKGDGRAGAGGRAEVVISLADGLRGELRGEMKGIAVTVNQQGIASLLEAQREYPVVR